MELINKLILENDIEGLQKLADEYYDGDNVEKDLEKAALIFYELAKLNDPYGCYSIGYCYKLGLGVEKSPEEAFYYFKQGSQYDYVSALEELGNCYMYGFGCSKDFDLAYDCFFKAAMQASNMGMTKSALLILTDSTNKGSLQQAMDFLSVAASNNFPLAIANLARIYFFGEFPYVKKDIEKAMYYLTKGVELNDGYCISTLAEAYLTGECGEKNLVRALELLELGKELNDKDAYNISGNIQAGLLKSKDKDIIINKDLKQAISDFEMAYELGNLEAGEKLVVYYLYNENLDKFKNLISNEKLLYKSNVLAICYILSVLLEINEDLFDIEEIYDSIDLELKDYRKLLKNLKNTSEKKIAKTMKLLFKDFSFILK